MGVRIRGTLGDMDPLNKARFKRSRSGVKKGYPLRGLPHNTPQAHPMSQDTARRLPPTTGRMQLPPSTGRFRTQG